jgi:DNA-binding transcriptional MerR regulator
VKKQESYSISEFSNMTGLPQSKIRYYEKQGLFVVRRQENGYRWFKPEDAFRVNAFRGLLLYGFSVEEAIRMLDEKQQTKRFEASLQEQKQALTHQKQLLEYRLTRLENALRVLEDCPGEDFAVRQIDDILAVYASHGRDFTVSAHASELIAQMVDLLSISSYARVVPIAQITGTADTVDPSYVAAMPASEAWRLGGPEVLENRHLHRLPMGKCLVYHRSMTRAESVQRESYAPMLRWLSAHNYKMCGPVIIFPSFMNLDGEGTDVETITVPLTEA